MATPVFRLVRDLSSKGPRVGGSWQNFTTPDLRSRSDEAAGLDWNGNAVGGTYWGDVLLRAKKHSLVVVPNVDACTAWCAAMSGLEVVNMKQQWTTVLGADGKKRAMPARREALVPSTALWAFHTKIDFAKKYMVPFFDMVEKNELPDMSLLEWLVTMGGIPPNIAREAVVRYAKARKGDRVLLHLTDRERLLAAAAAREEAVASDKPEASGPA